MPLKKDMTGQVFGRLTVIEDAGRSPEGQVLWLCRCECGATTAVRSGNLRNGHVRSCGCLASELTRARSATHGMKGTRIHDAWHSMIARTANPNHRSYPNYGGRGITVCERWRTFENFYADMSDGYAADLTLDRINTNGNYEPGNCRWATRTEQARNKRTTVILTWRGVSLAAAEWAERVGITYKCLESRLRRGWPVERALAEGVAPERLAALFGDRPPDREQGEEGPRCVCGDPIQLQDDADPNSWIHAPGSDTPCVIARPVQAREQGEAHCPAEYGGPGYTHCELPHGHTGQHESAMGNMRRATWGEGAAR